MFELWYIGWGQKLYNPKENAVNIYNIQQFPVRNLLEKSDSLSPKKF